MPHIFTRRSDFAAVSAYILSISEINQRVRAVAYSVLVIKKEWPHIQFHKEILTINEKRWLCLYVDLNLHSCHLYFFSIISYNQPPLLLVCISLNIASFCCGAKSPKQLVHFWVGEKLCNTNHVQAILLIKGRIPHLKCPLPPDLDMLSPLPVYISVALDKCVR